MTWPPDTEDPVFHGSVDLPKSRTSITIAAGPGSGSSYPPFEIRYVDGWSYIQIDAALRRPPTLRPDAQWVAYRKPHGLLPIPTRSIPPAYPVRTLQWLLTRPISHAKFADPPTAHPRRVTAQFAGKERSLTYTYSIDRSGRITMVVLYDAPDRASTKLAFAYTKTAPQITAPNAHVQPLAPNESLYPSTTTTPS
jgi:hypothetical protein